jgi:ribosomal protein S18 acetylase RimI-like enzyme
MAFATVRPATENDIEWIVSQEQRPEFESFIHRWSLEEHERNLVDPDKLYLIAVDGSGSPLAFVILGGLSSKARSIELVRMAVSRPDVGLGQPLLKMVIDKVFTELAANRLWLDVFDDNSRARHTYKAVGFREEGLLRASALKSNGELGSLIIMGRLKGDAVSSVLENCGRECVKISES